MLYVYIIHKCQYLIHPIINISSPIIPSYFNTFYKATFKKEERGFPIFSPPLTLKGYVNVFIWNTQNHSAYLFSISHNHSRIILLYHLQNQYSDVFPSEHFSNISNYKNLITSRAVLNWYSPINSSMNNLRS